jgi:small subunit ribosomal protein S6
MLRVPEKGVSMRPYELVVVLHPDLEIDVDTPIAKLEKLIAGVKGTITKRDNWGKKRLAYPVNKQQFGIYIYFELELEPEAVRPLDDQLRITEEVIRSLIVSKVVLQRPARLAKLKAETSATTKEEPVAPAAKE